MTIAFAKKIRTERNWDITTEQVRRGVVKPVRLRWSLDTDPHISK